MARVIYKYPLDIAKSQDVRLNRVHQLLCVQVQNDQPTLWAIVNPDSSPLDVEIRCYGTGNGNPEPDDVYIGTVQLDGFVWHYFQAASQAAIAAQKGQ